MIVHILIFGIFFGHTHAAAAVDSVTVLTPISGSVTEADVVLGNIQLQITVSGMKWPAVISPWSTVLAVAFSSSESETNGFDTVRTDVLDNGSGTNWVRVSDFIATVQWQPNTEYDIENLETIDFSINPTGIFTAIDGDSTFPVTFTDLLAIPPTSGVLSGQVSVLEAEVVSGGLVLQITLTGDKFASSWGDTQKTEVRLFATSATSETVAWNNRKASLLEKNNIVRTSDTVLTLTTTGDGNYDITATESISFCIPNTVLQGGGNIDACVLVSGRLQVNETTASVTSSPTAGGGILEGVIKAPSASQTWVIAISGDQFISGDHFINEALTYHEFWGSSVSTAEQATGWMARRSNIVQSSGITRVDNTTISVTLTADDQYDLTHSFETITIYVSNRFLELGGSSGSIVVTGGLFNISAVSFSATPLTFMESQIYAGGQQIVVNIIDSSWKTLTTSTKTAIRDGVTSTSTASDAFISRITTMIPTPASQVVIDGADISNVVISLLAADYNIDTDETLSLSIPNSAVQQGGTTGTSAVANTITIVATTAELTKGGGGNTYNENDINTCSPCESLTITITGTTFISTLDVSAKAAIRSGWSSNLGTTGSNWVSLISTLLPDFAITRTSDTILTLNVQAAALYEIVSTEVLTFDVPHSILADSCTSCSNNVVVVAPDLLIEPYIAVSISISGTAYPSGNEWNIRQGGATIIITISSDTWVSTLGNTNSVKQLLADGFVSQGTETLGWNNRVSVVLDISEPTAITRDSSTVVTITFQADSGYDITSDEDIHLILNKDLFDGWSDHDIDMGLLFTINATTCTASQTSEAEGAFADNTAIFLTLSGDTWATGATFDDQRYHIVDHITAADDTVAGWNTYKHSMAPDALVSRLTDTQLRVLITGSSVFSISSDQTLTAVCLGTAMANHAANLTAAPTLFIKAARGTLSGTLTTGSNGESDLQVGASVNLIIDLQNDHFVSTFTTLVKASIRSSIVSNKGAYTDGWETYKSSFLPNANIQRVSSTRIRLDFAGVASYEIPFSEILTITIPSEAIKSNDDVTVATIEIFPPSAFLAISTAFLSVENIRSGGVQLTIDLIGDSWEAVALTNETLVSEWFAMWGSIGLGSDASDGWLAHRNTVLPDSSIITQTGSKQLVVTLQAAAGFDPTHPETLQIVIPTNLLQIADNDVTVQPTEIVIRGVLELDHACKFRRKSSDGLKNIYECRYNDFVYLRADDL